MGNALEAVVFTVTRTDWLRVVGVSVTEVTGFPPWVKLQVDSEGKLEHWKPLIAIEPPEERFTAVTTSVMVPELPALDTETAGFDDVR